MAYEYASETGQSVAQQDPALSLDTETGTFDRQHARLHNASRSPVYVDAVGSKMQDSPSSPVKIHGPSIAIQEPYSGTIESGLGNQSQATQSPISPQPSIRAVPANTQSQATGPPHTQTINLPLRQNYNGTSSTSTRQTSEAPNRTPSWPLNNQTSSSTPKIQFDGTDEQENPSNVHEQLQYHHELSERPKDRGKHRISGGTVTTTSSDSNTVVSVGDRSPNSTPHPEAPFARSNIPRPASTNLGAELHHRGRSLTPTDFRKDSPSPSNYARHLSRSPGRALDRPASYIDLLNIPHSQQVAHQNVTLDNAKLRSAVGTNASLLDTRKTLDMYRANVKKTNDPAIQYEFAIFMVNAAQEASLTVDETQGGKKDGNSQADLIREARSILQGLADRSYVFAQYYLADGYASGLFNGGKQDYGRAFPLFVSAGKHGHAESSYRAALCYEFGWGSRKDYPKAVQFHRQAATKGHPGAATRLGKACLTGDMGLHGRQREGVKWLKRGAESADSQHNSAPYELGLLHITGYGDDVFKDEAYAAQLLTQAAELGHAEASLRMGQAYEHGLLTCPRDPALSIHFYNGAAQAGIPEAMMALCAWYMVGAEPVLEKDEAEAYEWAKRAAHREYPKAQYALGYFTEMGIGCRRDALEANVWYVKAADQGDERSKQRLAIIRSAETGESQSLAPQNAKTAKKKKSVLGGNEKPDEKDCIVM